MIGRTTIISFIILFGLIITFFVVLVLFIIGTIKTKKQELQIRLSETEAEIAQFNKMLSEHDENAIEEYIAVLDAFYAKTAQNTPPAELAPHKERQVKGFFEIYENPEISPELKERLKVCYMLNGLLPMNFGM